MTFKYRVISSIVGGGLLIALLLLRGYYITIPATIVALIGVYEFNDAFRKAGYDPMFFVSSLLTLLSIIAFVFADIHNFKLVIAFTILSFIFIMAYQVISNHQIIDIMITTFSIIYVVFPMIFIMQISMRPDNFLWLVFIIAISADVFAYIFGKVFGKNKLIEQVSPGKTVEGAIGGIIGCVIVTLLFKFTFLEQIDVWVAVVIGFLGAIISIIGDLTASKIKRYCKIKDFGKIIPGHGGVLDRFDSILFTATLIYTYVWLFG